MRRISVFQSIKVTRLKFDRPVDFDLETTWKRLSQEEETSYFTFIVNVRVMKSIVPILEEPSWGIAHQIVSLNQECDESGWCDGVLAYENLIAARTHLLGFGNAIEVISPEALRLSMIDFAEQIIKSYKN
jgi:predicted DNA-binding transcriptional regulator YafY